MRCLQNIKKQYSNLQIEEMKIKIDKIMSASPISLDTDKLIRTFEHLTDSLSNELENIKKSPINKTMENLISQPEIKPLNNDIFWHIGNAYQQPLQNLVNQAQFDTKKSNLATNDHIRISETNTHNINLPTPVHSTTNTYSQAQAYYPKAPSHTPIQTQSLVHTPIQTQSLVHTPIQAETPTQLQIPVQTPVQTAPQKKRPTHLPAFQPTPVTSIRDQTPYNSTTPQQNIYNGLQQAFPQNYSHQQIQNKANTTPAREQENTTVTNNHIMATTEKPTLPFTPSPSANRPKTLGQAMAMQIISGENFPSQKPITIHSIPRQSASSMQPVPETTTSQPSTSQTNPNFSTAIRKLADINASQTTFGDHIGSYAKNLQSPKHLDK